MKRVRYHVGFHRSTLPLASAARCHAARPTIHRPRHVDTHSKVGPFRDKFSPCPLLV
jgi:hypothetical protein